MRVAKFAPEKIPPQISPQKSPRKFHGYTNACSQSFLIIKTLDFYNGLCYNINNQERGAKWEV